MPIFDQGYQHWTGTLSGHALRWLTVAQQGVRAQYKRRWAVRLMSTAFLPALLLAGFLMVWGLIEQKSSAAAPFIKYFRLPTELVNNPTEYRAAVWKLAYHYFLLTETYISMLVVLIVGPDLISRDLRFNSIPLYFSRPVTRFAYFLGKLGVIGFFLGAVIIFPALLAFVLGLGFSLDLSVIKDVAPAVAGAVGYGALVVIVSGLFMLALSSLSRSSRYVTVFWIGIWFFTSVVSTALHEAVVMEPVYQKQRALSQEMYRAATPPPPAPGAAPGKNRQPDADEWARRAKIQEELRQKMTGIVQEAQKNDWTPLISYTANLDRVGRVLLDTDGAWEKFVQALPVPPEGRAEVLASLKGTQYPWTWSAAILAGILGLSVCILNLRVRSLDRLR
jgi:ABC-2 type transport system permease protein